MLAYHVEVVPGSCVAAQFVQLAACLLVGQLAVVVLRKTALIVEHPIHYLLD